MTETPAPEKTKFQRVKEVLSRGLQAVVEAIAKYPRTALVVYVLSVGSAIVL